MSDSLTTKIETPSITYEQPLGLYIDGKFVKGTEGKTFETINPSNEKPITSVYEAGPEGMPTNSRAGTGADMSQMSTSLSRLQERP